MENIRAIIFDLDNTLLDRTQTFYRFAAEFVDHYFPEQSSEEKRSLIDITIEADNDGYKEKQQMFEELLDLLPWDRKPEIAELIVYYTQGYVNSAVLMEDALAVLQHYHGSFKLGLITNGKTMIQYGKIDKLNIRSYFDVIVVSEEAGAWKPDPAIFEQAIHMLSVKPEEAVYIGDHPRNDMGGASHVGMNVIWMNVNQPWPVDLDLNPSATITRLNHLLQILKK